MRVRIKNALGVRLMRTAAAARITLGCDVHAGGSLRGAWSESKIFQFFIDIFVKINNGIAYQL